MIYRHAWTSSHTTTQEWKLAKSLWANALQDVPAKVIGQVIDKLISSGEDYPPSLPVFLKMCRKQDGTPTESQAFQLALRREFTHPLINMAYKKIGSWDFTHDTEVILKKKFKKAYQESVEELLVLDGQKKLEG